MKSGELFDKRKFPKVSGDTAADLEALIRWAFNFADAVEQYAIRREEKISEKFDETEEKIEEVAGSITAT